MVWAYTTRELIGRTATWLSWRAGLLAEGAQEAPGRRLESLPRDGDRRMSCTIGRITQQTARHCSRQTARGDTAQLKQAFAPFAAER